MKSTTARRVAILLLAAPLALTACSGGTEATPSGTTTAATTASLGDLTPGGTVDKAQFFKVTMAAAEANKTYAFTTQVGDSGSDLSSTGVVDNTDPANRKRQITLKDDKGESQLIIAGGKVYVKNANLLGGKWVESPVNPSLDNLLGGTSGRIEADQEIVKSITYVGEEDVAGTKTRHFTLTVDPTKATATVTPGAAGTTGATGAATPPATGTATAPATGTGTAAATGTAAPVTVEYWLDDKNRTRKMKHTVAGLPTVTTYEKWGEPVSITVPASDQITTTATATASGSAAPSASKPS